MDETKNNLLNEEQMVNDAFQRLIDSYLATRHRKKVEIITKAFNFANHAHRGVRRLSGEPYIMHPLAVAQIVCSEIGLGSTSICCALLHDVVEDTDYTVEDISNLFGPKIAQIVEGLTKISGGIFGAQASSQAENFKKLLLTMSEDIRVILVKIADRLHNMRTLGAQPENKKYKISGETLYIYAPLANRLGLNTIKTELENLSFKYEHPDIYSEIEGKLAATEAERLTVFDDFTSPIRQKLDAAGVKYQIKARIKTPYSIWHKEQTKHVTFEEIFDILAVRIVFTPTDESKEIEECFSIYAAISKIYTSHPERLRDWVSHPRANGYQALHVTMMSNRGEWVEVQIRSDRMNDIAEKGFAAHWKYKDGENVTELDKDSELDKWLVTIREILDDPLPDSMDFLDTIKLNLYASEIFVFTPKGEFKYLPAGSTALDFAFIIHTFVGSHCIGAKVNHRLMPLSYKLRSGDQVEILTSKSLQIKRSWLDIVTTAKAKTKIQTVLRREQKEIRRQGEAVFDDFMKNHGMERDTIVLDRLYRLHGCNSADEFFLLIGQKTLQLGVTDLTALREENKNSIKKLLSFGRRNKPAGGGVDTRKKKPDTKQAIVITEDTVHTQYRLADCCSPIPGDKAMGFADADNNIIIHKLQCPEAESLKAKFGNRIYAVRWQMNHINVFPVSIRIEGLDKLGVLNNIIEVIYKMHGLNMKKLEIESDDGIFAGTIQMFVHDTNELKIIIANLRKVPDIKSVMRV